jgi:uncharacterized protein involved in exopolysaccharide biosynthesis
MLNNSTNSYTDSYKVAVFLYKWRKTLLILGLSAAVLSAFFSSPLFISPLFKSTVILYPASSNSISKSLLSENAAPKKDILEYGDEEQTEKMLQILTSNRIREKVIAKFNLVEHYGIDSTLSNFHTRLFYRYNENITFKRTEYMAVKIAVLDKDPQLAADIANTIASLIDSVKNDMQNARAMQGFKIVEAEYLLQQRQVSVMEDSLTKIMKLGVLDYESQAEMLNRQLAKEIASGNSHNVSVLESRLKILANYGGSYISLREALLNEKKQLSFIKARYEEARVDAFESIPQKFIVENAFKADRKSYPIIWIIVVLSTLGTLMAALLVIYVVEKSPEVLRKLQEAE